MPSLPFRDSNLRLIARSGAINLIGLIASNAFAFLYQIVLTRSLTQADVGIFNLGVTIASLLGTFTTLGLDRSAVWFITKFESEDDPQGVVSVITSSLRMIAGLGLVLVVITGVASGLFSNVVFKKPELASILPILVCSSAFYAITRLGMSIFQAYKRVEPAVIVEQILVSLVRIVGVSVLLWAGASSSGLNLFAYSYTLAALVGCAIACLLIIGLRRYRFKNFVPQNMYKELIVFAWPLLGASLLNRTNAFTEVIIMGMISTNSEIGLYSVAWKLAAILMAFVEAFNAIFTTIVAENYSNNRIQKLQRQYKTVMYWAFSLTLPFGLIMILRAPELLQIFGEQYRQAAVILQILTAGQVLYVVSALAAIVLTMTGSTRANLNSLIANLILSIVLDFLLIPSYGALGAGIAGAITIVFVNGIRLAQVYRQLHIHPFSWKLVQPLLAGLAAAAVLVGMNGALSGLFYLVNLGVSSFITLGIYAGVFYLLQMPWRKISPIN